MSILEIKDVNIFYGNENVLKNINLNIEKNEIISIIGVSGSGKSTFLSLLNGFLHENGGKYNGEVYLENKNISSLSKSEIRRKICTLFQDSSPFPLSIEKNILYPLEYYEPKLKNKNVKIKEILEEVNLYEEVKDKLKKSAMQLSGGQKQRLCIARMLTVHPKILIFDEPCSSLDEENTKIIENLIEKLSKKYSIILTTHNIDQAYRISNRVLKIENKKLNIIFSKS